MLSLTGVLLSHFSASKVLRYMVLYYGANVGIGNVNRLLLFA